MRFVLPLSQQWQICVTENRGSPVQLQLRMNLSAAQFLEAQAFCAVALRRVAEHECVMCAIMSRVVDSEQTTLEHCSPPAVLCISC